MSVETVYHSPNIPYFLTKEYENDKLKSTPTKNRNKIRETYRLQREKYTGVKEIVPNTGVKSRKNRKNRKTRKSRKSRRN